MPPLFDSSGNLLEGETQLQIDPSVCRVAGEEAADQGVGTAEQRGFEVADRRGQVDIIEKVPHRNAERQVIPMVGGVPEIPESAPTSQPAAAEPVSVPTTTSEAAGSTGFSAESEGLAEAEVDSKLAKTCTVIGRDNCFAGYGLRVEGAPPGHDDAGP